jgi:hypothetical protein
MSDYLIVVVNRALARFFTLEPVEFPELESGPRLCPCGEMVNPELTESQGLYTDSRTGRGTAPPGGDVHRYEDNRDLHLDEVRRRFSASVVGRIHSLAKAGRVNVIVLAASARMRQYLYPGLETATRDEFRIVKIPKNMINFPSIKIHAYLAEEGYVPPRKKRTR